MIEIVQISDIRIEARDKRFSINRDNRNTEHFRCSLCSNERKSGAKVKKNETAKFFGNFFIPKLRFYLLTSLIILLLRYDSTVKLQKPNVALPET